MDLKFLQELQVGEAGLPQEVMDAILQQHEREMTGLRQDWAVEKAVLQAGGRSVKAIRALLEPDCLEGEALDSAMQRLKAEHGYLFETAPQQVYAPGPGTNPAPEVAAPGLAAALRQRMNRK